MPALVIASGNRHKVLELREMVVASRPDLEVVGMAELGAPPDVDEHADSFVGNAMIKAHDIARWLRARQQPGHTLVLADDSGIEVDVLDGLPGVRSARFAGPHASDADNNRKLVEALAARGLARSPARYRCALAVVRVDGERPDPGHARARVIDDALVFEGTWEVEIRIEARGSGGFGYDPHAWLDAGRRTVAELSRADKALQSHRGRAMADLLAWLRGRSVVA